MPIDKQFIADLARKARITHTEATARFERLVNRRRLLHELDSDPDQDHDYSEDSRLLKYELEDLANVIAVGLESIGTADTARTFRAAMEKALVTDVTAEDIHPDDDTVFWSPHLIICGQQIAILETAAGDELIALADDGEIRLSEDDLSPKA